MNTVLLAIRPKTLTASIAPIAAAMGYGYYFHESVTWHLYGLALLASVCIQIATNLFNDVIDFKKGADTENRVGPKRVTQSGQMSSKRVYVLAIVFCLLAVLCGLPLVAQGGLPIVVIGLVSLTMAYAYTGGPFPLAYLGLGDLFVMIFFGWVAVAGLDFLQSQQWGWMPLLLGTQIGALATVLIVINNMRDVDQDKIAGKLTLAVRWGERISKFEVATLYAIAFGLQSVWFFQKAYVASILPLLVLLPVIFLLKDLQRTAPGAVYNSFLARSAKIQILFSGLLFFGFVTDKLIG